jgi:hypothetical protein
MEYGQFKNCQDASPAASGALRRGGADRPGFRVTRVANSRRLDGLLEDLLRPGTAEDETAQEERP